MHLSEGKLAFLRHNSHPIPVQVCNNIRYNSPPDMCAAGPQIMPRITGYLIEKLGDKKRRESGAIPDRTLVP